KDRVGPDVVRLLDLAEQIAGAVKNDRNAVLRPDVGDACKLVVAFPTKDLGNGALATGEEVDRICALADDMGMRPRGTVGNRQDGRRLCTDAAYRRGREPVQPAFVFRTDDRHGSRERAHHLLERILIKYDFLRWKR